MEIVTKPWGYEKWIGGGRSYFLKEILLKAGKRSSLQFHNKKEETNYIISGQGVLTRDGKTEMLKPGIAFHILPGQIHRVEAITDLTMIEASTKELDDVIRVEDDYKRGNGRIEREHK
jgi:mannose-6-phosphate isomerase-like protein (cupin superfamily)